MAEQRDDDLQPTAARRVPGGELQGVLHVDVAFDWGEEINLDQAQRLVPAELHELPRRRRTPSSIAYRPPPLRFLLPPVPLDLPEVGAVRVGAEATVFDFAAVSVSLHLPFRLSAVQLTHLAAALADAGPLVDAARAALEPLHRKLLPAIQQPVWSPLNEEYFVLHFAPGEPLPPPDRLLSEHGDWVAGLVRLEAGSLSPDEIAEALRLRIRYSPEDLFVPDWPAAVLIDRDCDETLQAIEFANLQLLEFRHIDNRLDDRLAAAYGLIHPLARSWLPLWRLYARPLRALGELKVEANGVFERTSNVLKLVGDQYLARVYRLLATRFHLDDWTDSIRRSLDVVESVYRVVSDQAATYRTELLELIIVLLICFEIGMTLFGGH